MSANTSATKKKAVAVKKMKTLTDVLQPFVVEKEPEAPKTSPLEPIERSTPVPMPQDSSSVPEDHVVLQLPISKNRLEELLTNTDMKTVLEYNPTISEPQPYTPWNTFHSENDELAPVEAASNSTSVPTSNATVTETSMKQETTPRCSDACYWCCHSVGAEACGMPVQYDAVHKNFTMYGYFCSLECAAAMNFAMHMGSDRAWEVYSWIQMLGRRYGHPLPVRPAPSRYLLKMFQGPLTIEEFRSVHRTMDRTFVLNVPPFVSVSSQMDLLNTSFLGSSAWKGLSQGQGQDTTAKKQRAPTKRATDLSSLNSKLGVHIQEPETA